MFIKSFLFISLDCAKNSRYYLNWVILKKGWETLNFVKFFSISWLGSIPFDLFVFVWPIVAIEHLFRQDSLMFMHCSHVSFISAYRVFDKMPKWHFGIVLDFNECQTLEITMIIHVYHVLVTSCVLYTLWSQCALSCLAHASHMHTTCTLDAHTCSLVMIFAFQSY